MCAFFGSKIYTHIYPLWDIAFVRVFGYSVCEGCILHPSLAYLPISNLSENAEKMSLHTLFMKKE